MTGEAGDNREKAQEIFENLSVEVVDMRNYIPDPMRIHVFPDRVEIDVPNPFFSDSLRVRLRPHLATAIASSGLGDLIINTNIVPELDKPNAAPSIVGQESRNTPEPSSDPGYQKRLNFFHMHPPRTLDSFVAAGGHPNMLALNTCRGIVDSANGGDYPLAPVSVLEGPNGSGKSHLMCGLHKALGSKATLISGRDLSHSVGACFAPGGGGDLGVKNIFNFPFFLLDGFEGLGGTRTQQELTATLDRMASSDVPGCVVVSTAKPLDGDFFRKYDEALMSRLRPITPLFLEPSAPETAKRIAYNVLVNYLNGKQNALFGRPTEQVLIEVSDYIVSRLGADGHVVPRDVVLATQSFLNYAWTKSIFSLETAVDAFSRRGYKPPKNFNPSRVIAEVVKRYGLSVDQLRSSSRGSSAVEARRVATVLLRHGSFESLSYPDIGALVGRDYTTLLNSHDKLRESPKALESLFTLAKDFGIKIPTSQQTT